MRKFWAWKEVGDAERIFLLSNRRLTDSQARSQFNELPRSIHSQGIIPFVVGQGFLSKDAMDAAVGSTGGIIQ